MISSERATRKQLVDRALKEAGWFPIVPYPGDERLPRDRVFFF